MRWPKQQLLLVLIGAAFALLVARLPDARASGPLPNPQSTTETVALNAACSTLAAGAGIKLNIVTGWRALAVASSGVASAATFTSGTATCCFKSATTAAAAWTPCDSRLNIALVSGQSVVPGVDIRTSVPMGRVAYVGTSVVQSSGATFTMVYESVPL